MTKIIKIKDADRVKIGRRSRRKGKKEERVVGSVLGKWWFGKDKALRPRALSGGWSKKSSGDLVVDDTVADPSDWPFYVECKHIKTMLTKGMLFNILCGNLSGLQELWVDTVNKSMDINKIPILTIKGDNTGTLVICSEDIFFYCGINDDFCFSRIFFNTLPGLSTKQEEVSSVVIFNIKELSKAHRITDKENYIEKNGATGG